jgi:hypothetical protein
VLEVVGERGLAELLEEGPPMLRDERVLHELLGDGRRALLGLHAEHVLEERSPDAAQVHAVVLVVAAVLDRYDRVLDVRGDPPLVEDDPVLLPGDVPELLPAGGVHDRRLRRAQLGVRLERRQLVRHSHHHPEDRGDEGESAEPEEDQSQPQLLELRLRLPRRARSGYGVLQSGAGRPEQYGWWRRFLHVSIRAGGLAAAETKGQAGRRKADVLPRRRRGILALRR